MSIAEQPVGIRAFATVVGESTLTPEAFAARIGADPAKVAHWIGGQEIRTSTRSATELGADAARVCLEKAGVTAEQVDAIVWCTAYGLPAGRNELHVQHLLGAKNAFAVDAGTTCSELVTALWMAERLVAGGEVERALVVSGEQFQRGTRTLGLAPDIYQPVFSDVGSAALVARGEGAALLGFGAATDGQYWNALDNAAAMGQSTSTRADVPSLVKVFIDSIPLNRKALQRCLQRSGITVEQIDHLLLSREGPEIVDRVARNLGLLPKLVHATSGATHSGTADALATLESLYQDGRVRPGEHVVIGSRTIGVMRFAALRL